MPVVSNTSPILNLALIGQLDLLQRQFGQVLISPAVVNELKLNSEFPGVASMQQAMDAAWLRVVELKNNHIQQALMLDLDWGEASAIALALELGHQRILIDEREGRSRAKTMGLQPIGVLGILLRAKRERRLDSLRDAMNELQTRAGFFIAPALFEAVLIEAGEKD